MNPAALQAQQAACQVRRLLWQADALGTAWIYLGCCRFSPHCLLGQCVTGGIFPFTHHKSIPALQMDTFSLAQGCRCPDLSETADGEVLCIACRKSSGTPFSKSPLTSLYALQMKAAGCSSQAKG